METCRDDSDDEFIPISEAAGLARVSVGTMRRWGKQGKVSVYRTPGNQRRFRRSEAEALAEPAPEPAERAEQSA